MDMKILNPPSSRLLSLMVFAFALTNARAGAAQTLRHQPKPIGTITGQVFSESGFAVPNALVMLQDSDGKNPRTTIANSQGRFSFTKIHIGLYDVSASSKSRSSEWRHNVVVLNGKQTTVALHLHARKVLAPNQAAPNPAPTSLKPSAEKQSFR
jgi:hypothetical protein